MAGIGIPTGIPTGVDFAGRITAAAAAAIAGLVASHRFALPVPCPARGVGLCQCRNGGRLWLVSALSERRNNERRIRRREVANVAEDVDLSGSEELVLLKVGGAVHFDTERKGLLISFVSSQKCVVQALRLLRTNGGLLL